MSIKINSLLKFRIFRVVLSKVLSISVRIFLPTRNLSKKNQKIAIGISLFVILVMIPVIFYSLSHLRGASAAWFDQNFGYRQRADITNSGSAQTDFQVAITLDTSTLITAGKMQSNCNDIRITDINGKLLPFWIETGTTGAGGKACNASTTQIWTKVPSISTTGNTLYVYYGNPQASSYSNGNKVFEFFDDFSGNSIDSSKWSQGTIGATSGTAFSQSGGNLVGGNSSRYIQSAKAFTGDYVAQSRSFTTTDNANGFSVVGFYASSSNSFGILDHDNTSYYRNDSSWINFALDGTGQWSRNSAQVVGTTATYTRTGETSGSATATGITNSGISGEFLRLGPRYDDWASDQNFAATWDWVFVRKAAATAPSIAAPTNEENSPAPIAYWKFDEGTGTVANDSSSNKNNGTISSATWQTEDQCISGKCLFFNGTSSNVLMTSAPTTGTGSFSAFAWVKTSDTGARKQIFMWGSGATDTGAWLFIDTNNKIGFDLSNHGGTTSTTTVTDGKWHYVGVVNNAGSFQIYVDGKADGSSVSMSPNLGSTYKVIGTNTESGIWYFKGFIDEPKIYSYARTAAQIKTDYNSRGSVKGVSAQIGTSDANKNLSNGLVGYWKQDEASWNGTSGEMIDSSGNGNNGTSYGGAIATPSAKFGKGGYFDGDNDSATVSAATSTNFTTTGGYSVGFWINPQSITNSPNGTSLLAKTNTGNGWDFHITSNGTLGVYFPGSSNCTFGGSCYSTTILPTSQWSHIIFTYNSGVFNLYLNGVLIKSATVNGAINNTGDPIYFSPGNAACSGMFSCAYKGTMDEARIYNRALSPSEVSQLYNFAPGPIVYYNFDEGNFGGSAIDSSGNGLTGTVTGVSNSTGKFGKGAKFNGTSNNIVTTDNATLRITAYSVSVWIKPEVNNVYWTGIIGKPGRNFNMWFGNSDTSTGYIHHRFHDTASWNSGCPDSSGVPIDGKTWTYVTITNDGTTCKTYFNGVLQQQGSVTGSLVTDNSNLQIGTSLDGGGSGYFKGNMDEVKIYNYARTSGQIVSDMNAGHPNVGSPVGSAVGYWKMDEGYGAIANNSGNGGSALKGTLTGSPWTNQGKFGKALAFNGTSDQVYGSIPANTFSGDFTITAWFNHKAVTAWGAIFSNSVGTNETAIMTMRNATTEFGIMRVGILDSGVFVDLGSDHYNKWIYGVIKREGNTLTVYAYKDGKLIKNSGALSWTLNTDNEYYIGRHYSSETQIFNGTIDEVKVYSSALTDSEIKLDYNHGASQVLGSMSDTSGLTGGQVASNSASAAYCIPGDSGTCSAPVAEWSFEEGQGSSVNDSSGNGLIGTMTNSATWTSGKFGKAGNFNGASVRQGVQVSNNALLNPGTGSFTTEAWIKTSQTGTVKRIVTKRGSSSTWYSMFIQNGKLDFETAVTYPTYYSATAGNKTINDGQWHHVVMVRDTSQSKVLLYVDGTLDVSPTDNTAGQSITNSEIFEIGIWGSEAYDTGSYTGKIDQVRVFNYARSAAQVAYDYNRGGPVGWWKFDECQGLVANDSSGLGNNGTITIGGSGTQTSVGTCTTSSTAWGNGATGKYNASLNFDGTDDYVSKSSPTGLPSAGGARTISVWNYRTSGAAARAIAAINDTTGTNQSYILNSIVSAGQNFFTDGKNGANNITSSKFCALNTWCYTALTLDGSNGWIYYINGNLVTSGTFSVAINTTSTNVSFSIGRREDGANTGSYFPGQIDDIRIYNYALTKQQIQQVYNQGGAVRFGPVTGTP